MTVRRELVLKLKKAWRRQYSTGPWKRLSFFIFAPCYTGSLCAEKGQHVSSKKQKCKKNIYCTTNLKKRLLFRLFWDFLSYNQIKYVINKKNVFFQNIKATYECNLWSPYILRVALKNYIKELHILNNLFFM